MTTATRRGVLLLVAGLAVLGACGSSSSTSSTPAPSASSSVATTTTVASADIEAVDWENFRYPDRVCNTEKSQQLTDGHWTRPDVPYSCGMSFLRVGYADVTGAGTPNAVVTILNNGGGTSLSVSYTSYVYEMEDDTPVAIGTLDGEGFPPYSAVGIDTWTRLLGPNDPTCCPKQYTVRTYTYANGAFRESGTKTVPTASYPGPTG